MKFYFLLFFIFFQIASVSAQYLVKGTVQDSSGLGLPGAIVRVKFQGDSVGITADINGNFAFKNIKSPNFIISAAFIGFQNYIKEYKFDDSKKDITVPVIKLQYISTDLNEVIITAATPVRIKEDTVEFNASSFPVREGDAIEEVLKKLPGIEVDKDGNVTTQGKPITKIRLNGKDFFGTDVATAIQNLPADIVKNLQVIDDYGDQANLTGIKTGDPEKVLNINVQEDKKRGYFARGTGGMGNSDRYIANVRGNSFKGERQISFNGIMNNTNMRGGGGGDGVTNTKSVGLNYRNEWNKKISANGGYNYRSRENNTFATEYTQNFLQDFTRIENSINENSNNNNDHNFWGNFEYTIDTLNFLKISPNFSFNSSDNYSTGNSNISQPGLLTLRDNFSATNASSANVGGNVFFNHKFQKKGRNASVFSYFNYSKGDNFRDAQNEYVITDSVGADSLRNQYQLIDNNTRNTRIGANFSYTEPVGKRSFLELNYNHTRSATTTGVDTRDVEDGMQIANPNLSNNFEYQFTTNRVGLNYKFIAEKYHYTLGLSAQPALLEGQNISKNISTHNRTLNWIPSARMVYRFTKQKTFTLNYNGRSNQPGFNQLQPLTDSSNLQNTVIGNPYLKPEFTHGVNVEYNQSDWNQGHTLFANFSFSQTENKIVTTKIQVPETINQVTSYTNTDGFYNIRGDYSYSKPFADRKFTIVWEGGASLNNNIAFNDNVRINAKNFLVNQGLEFKLDLKDIVDLGFKTSYSINKTHYSQSFEDRQTNRLMFSLEGRNYFFKDLSLGYDFSKAINSGFNNAAVKNPTLLRLYMEYRFLKGNMGTIRLQGFDLFNQNEGISRDVFDNVIVDRQTNRLGRYFLMTFGLRLSKFGAK